ncbi:MAG: ADP-ribosylglycohydrolase family protein [Bacillota bacterium]
MIEALLGAIMGLCVGDALGVPVEGQSRGALAKDPVTQMRGFGTYRQPAGTWSDDTSMTLCLLDSLALKLDYDDIMRRFTRWLYAGEFTPYGVAFGAGSTTREAVAAYARGESAQLCGGRSVWNNGNGSLMRILPLAFYLYPRYGADIAQEEPMRIVHDVSSLTHAHPCSLIACGMYIGIACGLLGGRTLKDALSAGLEQAFEYYDKRQTFAEALKAYHRLRDWDEFCSISADGIFSSGYVVHTLEAALYCLANTKSYRSCVLGAVNLGQDTDTVAAVAGGLAGLAYGYEAIPIDWIFQIPRRGWIEELCRSLFGHLPHTRGGFSDAPEYGQLKSEAARALERLTSLIVERDTLLYRTCKAVETDYMLKIGALEYSLQQSEYAVKRLRRKIELIAAQSGTRTDPAAMEAALECELSEQKEELTLLAQKLRSAIRHGSAAALESAQAERLQALYRYFSKHLHPELRPKGSIEDRLLYARVLAAFEDGDIPELEAIRGEFHQRNASDLAPVHTPDELRRKIGGLAAQCGRVEEQIESIRASFPLKERAFLSDDALVRVRQAELQSAIASCRKLQSSLEVQAELLQKGTLG